MIISVANPIYDSVFKFLMEDEYFSAIENRDTELMMKKQELEETKKELTETKSQLTEKDNQLTEKDNQLKSMAQAMLDNGMSIEVIAQAMGKNVTEIKSLLKH